MHFRYQSSVDLDCYFCHPYFNLGTIYESKGELEKAYGYYLNAAEDFFLSGKTGGPFCYGNASRIALRMGLIEEALKLSQKTLSLKQQINSDDKAWLIPTYILQGEIFTQKGEVALANQSFKQASSLLLDFPNYEFEGDLYLAKARLESNQKHKEQIVNYFLRAFDSWAKHYGLGHEKIREAHLELGQYLFDLGDLELAQEYFNKGLQLHLKEDMELESIYSTPNIDMLGTDPRVLNLLEKKGDCFLSMYNLSKNETNLAAALSTFELGIQYIEQTKFSFPEGSKLDLLNRNKRIFEKAIQTALNFYHLSGEDKHLELAFKFLEKSKSGILRDALNKKDIQLSVNLPKELRIKEKTINEDLGFYEKLVFEEQKSSNNPNSEKISYWQEKTFKLQRDKDEIEAEIKSKYTDYYEQYYKDEVVAIKSFQKNLPINTVALNYFTGEKSIYLFIVTKDQVELKTIPINTELINKVDAFKNGFYDFKLKKQDINTYLTTSLDLLNLLIPNQLLQSPELEKMLILPDGFLGYLPFHAFTVEQDNTKNQSFKTLNYLFQTLTCSYEYSATLFQKNRSKRNRSKEIYSGFAPIYAGDSKAKDRSGDSAIINNIYLDNVRGKLKALHYNKDEVDYAASIFNGISFTNEAATEENFKYQGIQSKIIHIASHALINDEDPSFSHFVFSKNEASEEDGYLYAYELSNLDFDADLAVLSA
ncbi:MAG: CHAT domain-containing protein, partial [Bacteroidota bacterium]